MWGGELLKLVHQKGNFMLNTLWMIWLIYPFSQNRTRMFQSGQMWVFNTFQSTLFWGRL